MSSYTDLERYTMMRKPTGSLADSMTKLFRGLQAHIDKDVFRGGPVPRGSVLTIDRFDNAGFRGIEVSGTVDILVAGEVAESRRVCGLHNSVLECWTLIEALELNEEADAEDGWHQ